MVTNYQWETRHARKHHSAIRGSRLRNRHKSHDMSTKTVLQLHVPCECGPVVGVERPGPQQPRVEPFEP